jgi:regulator of cell morphogenesis and NO signaling
MIISKDKTVAEVVAKKMGSDRVFSKYKIDFCCGGGATMDVACEESGVQFEVLKNEIEAIATKISSDYNLSELNINALIKEIKSEYFNYFDENSLQLLPLASKVAEVHGAQHPEVIEVSNLFKGLALEISKVIKTSEKNLFVLIIELNKNPEKISDNQHQNFRKWTNEIGISQKLILNTLDEIKNISNSYHIPESACSSYKFLYEKLQEFDHQYHRYLHIERNIFIPKVLKKYSINK